MNELVVTSVNLPDNIEDLSKFVLVGQEKVIAVRAEIKAMNKLKLADAVVKQKSEELQMITEALVDAQVRVGQLTTKIPKATPNNNVFHEISPEGKLAKPKAEAIKDLGFSQKQVHEFEQMAKHPEAVKQAKIEARESGETITRARVLKRIKEKKAAEKNTVEIPSKPIVIDTSKTDTQKPAVTINEWNEYEAICKAFSAVGSLFTEYSMELYANIFVNHSPECLSKNDLADQVGQMIETLTAFKAAILRHKVVRVMKN